MAGSKYSERPPEVTKHETYEAETQNMPQMHHSRLARLARGTETVGSSMISELAGRSVYRGLWKKTCRCTILAGGMANETLDV